MVSDLLQGLDTRTHVNSESHLSTHLWHRHGRASMMYSCTGILCILEQQVNYIPLRVYMNADTDLSVECLHPMFVSCATMFRDTPFGSWEDFELSREKYWHIQELRHSSLKDFKKKFVEKWN